jgi:nucleotide-binding universal stress UspA family protein
VAVGIDGPSYARTMDTETIVVGVDGSAGAAAALEFAVREATLRKARLRIVSAWETPVEWYTGGLAPPLDDETLGIFRAHAQNVVGEALAAAKKELPSSDVESVVVEGQAADVLLGQSADASLLVVGSRGRGGFTSLMLGSVSQQVVHHANRPVVVVHPASG